MWVGLNLPSIDNGKAEPLEFCPTGKTSGQIFLSSIGSRVFERPARRQGSRVKIPRCRATVSERSEFSCDVDCVTVALPWEGRSSKGSREARRPARTADINPFRV